MNFQSWPVEHVAAIYPGGSFGDSERVFPLASVTKPLVAYAVLVAVEEGAIELDEPTRQLLAHASGVGFDTRELQRPAGTRRIYSSAGFEMLADAVEAATEIPFAEYFNDAVCAPLGMTRTRLLGSAGHGAESCVADLAAFAQEVIEPKLLDESTVADACSVQYPELSGIVPGYGMFKPCPWGLGFEIHGEKSPHWMGQLPPDTVGHFGQSGTFLWIHRPSKTFAAVLTDRAFGDWAKPLWEECNTALAADFT